MFDIYNHILCIYTASWIIGYKLVLYPFCCDLVLIWNIWALIIGSYCLACAVFEFLIIRSWLTRQNSPVDRIKMHFTRIFSLIALPLGITSPALNKAIPIST